MNRLMKLMMICAVGAVLCASGTAVAQNTTAPNYGSDSIDATGVGISGGVIAGAELIVAVEALIGVKKLWPYLTFPLLGAAGGGIGGYYLEQASPGGAVGLLAGSLVLFVPTIIAASAARSYDPDDEETLSEDDAGGVSFSFESNPNLAETPEESSGTEVEARPEGAAEGALPPPGAEGPPPEAAPEAAPESEPEAAPEAEAPSGTDASTETSMNSSRRGAAAHAPVLGALLNVGRTGRASLSVPLVDVRPSAVQYGGGVRSGVQVFVPLLNIDLP